MSQSNMATFAFFFKLSFLKAPSDLYHVNNDKNLDLTSKANDECEGNINNFNVRMLL